MRHNKPAVTLGRQFNAKSIIEGLPYSNARNADKRLARLRKRHDLDRKFKEATADIWG